MTQPPLEAIATLFNSFWFFFSFTVIAFIFILNYTKQKKVFIISLVLTLILALALKEYFSQARPCAEIGSTLCNTIDAGGFPSAHAAITTALTLGALGTALFYPMALIAILVSLSRLWINVHTIAQVVGGLALAVMVYLAVAHLNHKLYGDYENVDLEELFGDNLLTKRVD